MSPFSFCGVQASWPFVNTILITINLGLLLALVCRSFYVQRKFLDFSRFVMTKFKQELADITASRVVEKMDPNAKH